MQGAFPNDRTRKNAGGATVNIMEENLCYGERSAGLAMKPIHLNGDNKRLYFTNYERRSDVEEYLEIVSILKKYNYTINETIIGPDCDLHCCEIGGYSFDIIRTIDGDGTFLYCDDEQGMKYLESIFNS